MAPLTRARLSHYIRVSPIRYTLRRFQSSSERNRPIGSHMSDNDASRIEKAKQELLSGKTKSLIDEAPGWSEELASDSEAIIKAETSGGETIEEMKKKTIEFVTKKHK
ncbi:hypothetical protein H4R35_001018 [Dimargaris xerosporica]|nr:hypothetical protein H4R35_001018 [Dimargaris xerosporica]